MYCECIPFVCWCGWCGVDGRGHILSSYEPMQRNELHSNMAILEVELPSGYTTDSDSLVNLASIHNVKKIETKNADTVYILYFDSLEANRMLCPVFDAYQAHKVDEPKPASISLYDYYDSGKEIIPDNYFV